MDVREFADLKARKERGERDAAKAAGVIEEILSQLRAQFDCDSLEQSELIQQQYSKHAQELDQRYVQLAEESKAKFPDFWSKL